MLSEKQPLAGPASYGSLMEDVQSPVLARVAAFLVALALVAAAGWTAGRVTEPPIPVPELPRPAVLGGPGQDGSGTRPDGSPLLVPPHGGGGGHAG